MSRDLPTTFDPEADYREKHHIDASYPADFVDHKGRSGHTDRSFLHSDLYKTAIKLNLIKNTKLPTECPDFSLTLDAALKDTPPSQYQEIFQCILDMIAFGYRNDGFGQNMVHCLVNVRYSHDLFADTNHDASNFDNLLKHPAFLLYCKWEHTVKKHNTLPSGIKRGTPEDLVRYEIIEYKEIPELVPYLSDFTQLIEQLRANTAFMSGEMKTKEYLGIVESFYDKLSTKATKMPSESDRASITNRITCI